MHAPGRLRCALTLLSTLCVAAACSGSESDGGDETVSTSASITTATATTSATAMTTATTSETSTSTATSTATSTSTSTAATTGVDTQTSSTGSTGDTLPTGGETSSTGDDSGGEPAYCQEACAVDDDCTIDGDDAGYSCQGGRCRPAGNPNLCTDDVFCQVIFVASVQYCEMASDCPADRACVALKGYDKGLCAVLSDGMGGGCGEEYGTAAVPLLEGGEAEVCTIPDFVCDPGNPAMLLLGCVYQGKCRSDEDCASYPSAPVCGADGACECTSDTHCVDVIGLPSCVAGRCACTSDRDCAGLAGADVCTDGQCGCNSARICPKETAFDGTEVVCEPI